MKFNNKVVVITEAPDGFGTEITKRYINEGAKVVAADISTESPEKVSDEINKSTRMNLFLNKLKEEKFKSLF